VDVVRRGDDDAVNPGSVETAPELLHAGSSLERDVFFLWGAGLGDRDPSMRSDRGKHKRHAPILASEMEQLTPLRLTEYSHGAG